MCTDAPSRRGTGAAGISSQSQCGAGRSAYVAFRCPTALARFRITCERSNGSEHAIGSCQGNAARGGVVTVLEEEAESGEARRDEEAQRKLATRASASGTARRSGRGLEAAMAGSN